MGTHGVHLERVLSWLVRWAVVPVQEIFILPWPSWSSTTYFFSSPFTISLHLFPWPSKLCRQSCRVAGLLICVSGTVYRGLFFILLFVNCTRTYIKTRKYIIYFEVGDLLILGERRWEHLIYQMGDSDVISYVIKNGNIVFRK